jgi:phosphohistidine phosphatase
VRELAPGAKVAAIAGAAGWPRSGGTLIVVGHQPDLGRAAAYFVSGKDAEWSLGKGALWWLAAEMPVIVKAVMSPDLL